MALLDNLMAFYEFENNGNDAHTGGYTLTAENTPTYTTGIVNTAVAVSGAGYPNVQCLYRASNADLQNGDIDFSYAGWVYLTSVAADKYVMCRWGATVASFRSIYLQYASSFGMRFVVGDGTTFNDVYATNFGTWGTNAWHYVAFGHRATANQIWISVDAGTANTASHTAGVLAGSARLLFGGLDTDDGGLTDQGIAGRMDQWGYWKRDISSDVSTLYNGGAGLSYAGMGGSSPSAPFVEWMPIVRMTQRQSWKAVPSGFIPPDRND